MMGEICKVCGLPPDLCACEDIAKEQQKIRLSVVKRKYGKPVTLVEGIDTKQINIKELAKKLKRTIACGGTVKVNVIELQGKQKEKVKQKLIEEGFTESQIEMK